jgi:hypothetical protein
MTTATETPDKASLLHHMATVAAEQEVTVKTVDGKSAPIHRPSNRSDSATGFGHIVRDSCSSTSATPQRIRPPSLNHK